MANQKISELTQTSSLGELDLIPIAHYDGSSSYETQSTTFSSLKSSIVGSSGAITKLVYEDGDEAIYTSGDTLYLYNDSGNKVAYLNPIDSSTSTSEPDPNFMPKSKLAIGTSSVVEGIIKYTNRSKTSTSTLVSKYNLSDEGFRVSREEYKGSDLTNTTGAWQLRMNSLDTYMYSKNHVEITAGSKKIASDLSLSDLLTSSEADRNVRINLLSGGDIMNTARDAIYFTAPVFHVKNGNEDSVFTITATDTKLQDASQGNILSQHYDSTNTANNTIKLSRGGASDVLEQNKTQTFLRDSNGDNFIYVYNDTDIENNTLNITRSGNNDVLTQSKNNTYLLNSNGKWLLNGYFDGSDAANNKIILSRGGVNNVLYQDKDATYINTSNGSPILDSASDTVTLWRNGNNPILIQNTNNTYLENSYGNAILTCYTTDESDIDTSLTLSRGYHNDILSQNKNNTYLRDSNGNEVVSYVINATTATQQDLYLKSTGTNVLSHHIDTVTPANNTLTLSCAGSPVVKRIGNNTLIHDKSGRASFISYYDGDDSSVTIQRGKGADSEQEPFLNQNSTTTTICDSMSREMLKSVWGSHTDNTLTLSRFGHNVLTQAPSQTVLYEPNGSAIFTCDYDGSNIGNNVLTISRGNNELLSQNNTITMIENSYGNRILSCTTTDDQDVNTSVVLSRGAANTVLSQDKTTTNLINSDGKSILKYAVDATYSDIHSFNLGLLDNSYGFLEYYDDPNQSNGGSYVNIWRGSVNVLSQDKVNTLLSDSNDSPILMASFDGSNTANNTLTLARGSHNDVLTQDKTETYLHDAGGDTILFCSYDSTTTDNNIFDLCRGGGSYLLHQDINNTYLCQSNGDPIIKHTVGAGVTYSSDDVDYFKLYNNAITVSQPVSSTSTITATGLAATVQTLTDAASIAWNAAAGTNAIITLTAAGRTLANPTNIVAGTVYRLTVNQDATGSRTISTWGSYFKFPGGVTPTLTSTASACDVLEFYADTTTTLRLTNFIADSK